MKTTKYGEFTYEDDGYTPSESPEEKTYEIYLDDEQIGMIVLQYHTRQGYSNAHGWTDVREGRDCWYFHDFDEGIMPIEGPGAVNMEFPPHRFHNIKGAFKHCVEIVCEALDEMETAQVRGMAQQKDVCVMCDHLIAEHDEDSLRSCFTSLHLASLDDHQHEEWVEFYESSEVSQ